MERKNEGSLFYKKENALFLGDPVLWEAAYKFHFWELSGRRLL